jgi:hypothetical protein
LDGNSVERTSLRIVSPNGHLGFGKTKLESFELALQSGVDYVIADSGSSDVGPRPLGSHSCASPSDWQYHDLKHLLLSARKHGVLMIIGSAGDAGSRHGVDLFVGMIRRIAEEESLEPFTIGYFYSDVTRDWLLEHLSSGGTIRGLDGRPDADAATVERTSAAVAVAGVHPYLELLDRGVDVIIGGRSSDCAIFAAPAIRAGLPEAPAYFMGKVLECASFCAEPYGAKESVIGEAWADAVDVTAMAPHQRCTPSSVASHSMYERSHPYFEYYAGGMLDMSECAYEQVDERTTRVTGFRNVPSERMSVKIEGSARLGSRYIGIAAVRDGHLVKNVDAMIEWARSQVTEAFGTDGYELYFHTYGRDGVLGARERTTVVPSEIAVMVEAVAPEAEEAESICMTAVRGLFYARIPGIKGTAGNVAYPFDEVVRAEDAYEWSLNHVVDVEDPLSLFSLFVVSSRESSS